MDDIRKCAECKHYVKKERREITDNSAFTIWGCELWECNFESKQSAESEGDNDT